MKGFGLTDVGRKRNENQDCFALRFLNDDTVVCAVCDGMGGARGGSVASAIAREEFILSAVSALEANPRGNLKNFALAAAQAANVKIYERSRTERALRGMGTTLVGALLRENESVVINIGDSRAYIISQRRVRRITRDHSYVEELLISGDITPEQAKNHPKKHIITRALGDRPEINADIYTPKFSPGETMLFCTDGLSNLVTDAELRAGFKEFKGEPEPFCGALLATALSRGAPDNVTVVALRK